MPIEDKTYEGQQLNIMRFILRSMLTEESVNTIVNFEVNKEEHWAYDPSPIYLKKFFRN